MQSFTIRDIENLTGIKAHTLRIWEQRYNFFKPKRKESLHRFYDNEHLKKLLRIAFLYHKGWKISKIAALSEAQVIREIAEAKIDGDHSRYITQLLEAAIDFNEAEFTGIIEDIKSKIGFDHCISRVCYPYLQKLGLLWSTNNIIPAQEHFSSYIIQNKIIAETEKAVKSSEPPEVILACPEGEFHELPLLFINYLLHAKGCNTIYLGSNISTRELQQAMSISGIRYIYMHLITNFTGSALDDYMAYLCVNFPDKQIVASGDGMKWLEKKWDNLTVLQNDQQIREFVDSH
jgi:MerR family transcriptional regulator, light-induced transcriptional regulator